MKRTTVTTALLGATLVALGAQPAVPAKQMATSAATSSVSATPGSAPAPAKTSLTLGHQGAPRAPFAQTSTLCGVQGVGNPTESSTMSQGSVPPATPGTAAIVPIGIRLPVTVLSTTVGLTGVLEVEDGTDLDLLLLDPLDNVVASSETNRPTEVIRWTPTVLGVYSFLIVNRGTAVSPYTAYVVTTTQLGLNSTSATRSASQLSTADDFVNVDCNDPGISRSGGWHEVDDTRATGGQYCRNVGAGHGNAFMEFTFDGAGLDMQIARGPRGGLAELFMDGVSRGVISFYRPPTDPNNPDNSGKRDLTFGDFIRLTTSTPGTHVFRLESANDISAPGAGLQDMIYVDGFVIYCTQTPTAVGDGAVPGFHVAVHYSHPPRGPVELELATPEAGPLRVELFDLNGRLVRTVLDEPMAPAGTRRLPLDGVGADGRALGSSVYYYRVQSRDRHASGSVLFLK